MPMTLDMSAIFSLPTTASSVGHFTNKGKVGSLRWEAGKEVNRKWGINQQIKVILHSKPIFAVNFTPISSTDLSGFVCCLVFQRPIAVVQGVPCLLPCDSWVRVQQPQPQVDSGGDQPRLAVRVEIQLNLNICYVPEQLPGVQELSEGLWLQYHINVTVYVWNSWENTSTIVIKYCVSATDF